MRLKRLVAVLALAAGIVGVAPAVAAPMAAAFNDSPSVSATDPGGTTLAGRSWGRAVR